jgi:hypothetical protein
MRLIARSTSTTVRKHKQQDKKLLYDHTQFNEAIEIVIKLLDRYDRIDRAFAQE